MIAGKEGILVSDGELDKEFDKKNKPEIDIIKEVTHLEKPKPSKSSEIALQADSQKMEEEETSEGGTDDGEEGTSGEEDASEDDDEIEDEDEYEEYSEEETGGEYPLHQVKSDTDEIMEVPCAEDLALIERVGLFF